MQDPHSLDPVPDAVDISVIIPHYNDVDGLALCLAAVASQRGIEGYSVEVIVADNNSRCGLDAVRRVAEPTATVILASEQGAGPARNAAVRASRGRMLAFTDSDCIVGPDWLAEGAKALQSADLVGGEMIVTVRSEDRMSGAEAFERAFAFNNQAYVTQKNFSVTANLFCHRSVFDAVGPFRKAVSEDMEWCQRAVSMGYCLGYADKAVVAHPARENWQDLLSKWRRISRESFALRKDRGEPVWRWLAATWALPLSIVPHSLAVLRSRKVAGGGNKARGVSTLIAHRLWRFWDQHRLVLEWKKSGE